MTGEGHIQVNINTAQFASGKGGSIPTCAGQTSASSESPQATSVYPHVCGAAQDVIITFKIAKCPLLHIFLAGSHA